MPDHKNRLLLGYRGGLYKMATLVLSHTDGSLYINLTRKGKSPLRWTFELNAPERGNTKPIEIRSEKDRGVDISYHSTGLIRFKKVWNTPICGEPLNCVTKHFCFAKYSVPSIDKLDPTTKRAGDMVFPLPDEVEGRVTFSFIVSPLAEPQVVGDFREFGVNILFDGLCSINCVVDRSSPTMPPGLSETFSFFTPAKGVRDGLMLSEDQASILFHQRLTGISSRHILYPPNPEGVYRIVFPTEMHHAPTIRIEFADPQYSAEFSRITRGSAWFRVRDRIGNGVKPPVQITSIETIAEL
jgi:hypothetical protein